ncbi:MAG: type II toxin-antitoxin system Phd/YefM family antitoxin [Phycisphaerales bacterium]
MIRPTEIVSLTDFKRNTPAHLKRLKKGGVQVLTVNGRAEVVAVSPKAYEKQLAWIEHMETRLGIERGLADLKAGRTKPAAGVIAAIREGLADIRRGGGLPFDQAMARARERRRHKGLRSASGATRSASRM